MLRAYFRRRLENHRRVVTSPGRGPAFPSLHENDRTTGEHVGRRDGEGRQTCPPQVVCGWLEMAPACPNDAPVNARGIEEPSASLRTVDGPSAPEQTPRDEQDLARRRPHDLRERKAGPLVGKFRSSYRTRRKRRQHDGIDAACRRS